MSRFAALLVEFFYDPDEPVPPALDLPSLAEESERPYAEKVPDDKQVGP